MFVSSVMIFVQDQLKKLRLDLDSAQSDLRQRGGQQETRDTGNYQLESKLRERDNENQRLLAQITNIEIERKTLADKVKDLDGQLRLSENKVQVLRDDSDKLKRELSKAESLEAELKKTASLLSKTQHEYQLLKDQHANSTADLAAANARRLQLESELQTARNNLRDNKQLLHEANNRVNDLQRALADTKVEKNRLEDRSLSFEKVQEQ